MPELPEVETTLRGLEPHLLGHKIIKLNVTQPRLRWPVPDSVQQLTNATIESMQRRAKYLLMQTDKGHLIWHLGMSGSMRILDTNQPPALHEHINITLDNGKSLRYRDPRRFGFLLHTNCDPLKHKLLSRLGPEPLSEEFNAAYLMQQCKHRKSVIKTLLMNNGIVVGIGNIYACESLFLSGINPTTRGSRISLKRFEKLVHSIKAVLKEAIKQGGTTLQDFSQTNGKPGYFSQSLKVYGNRDQCACCGVTIKRIVQGQRSTFYCPRCQT